MSNIKKFRITSYKKDSEILSVEKLSLKFGKKIILDNLNLNLNLIYFNSCSQFFFVKISS